ncbi:MAG: hypothetical protein JSS83_03545 [Cyanobacteria bacterium SZAS LIN-3]|nr:hypothetical protein [Cyanobacteria bacterium SZAS LIN-3]
MKKKKQVFALCCLLCWIALLVVEGAGGGHLSGTNALSYSIVNATMGLLPWPAVVLGCRSSRWLIRIPSGFLALALVFVLLLDVTWGNGFDYRTEMSQYELLSMKRLDQSTVVAKYRFNPGAFSSFREITQKEKIVCPGVIFVQVISNTRE